MTARRIDLAPDADIRRTVAAHPGGDLVIVILPGRDSLDQAMVEAAIAPLAVMAAPGARINAVVPTPDAGPDTVAAAVAYLAAAHAVTGQLLSVGT
ncbi:Rossmann fold domain-containing protein [Sphingomonas sp. NPDC019816]|uniref:Rossmann fold domain-containing protein n=1 Tax=Sphingomonas sp. NPDC019816 TaxID=3390679 RepID=UPI003D0889DD